MGKKKKHTLGPNNTYMSFGPMLHPFSSFAGMWGHGMGLGEGVGGVGGGVVVVVVKKEGGRESGGGSGIDGGGGE